MDDWRTPVFIVGVLILIFTLFRMGRRRRARPKPAPRDYREAGRELVRPEPPTSVGGQGSGGGDGGLSELLVQVQEISREIEGRLDTRVRHAQRLLDDSEKVLYQLDAKIAEAKAIDSKSSEPAADELFATEPSVQSVHLLDVTDQDDQAGSDEPRRAVTRDPNEAEIARLAAEGESADAIANAVERPVGEVQLILSLIEAKNRNAS